MASRTEKEAARSDGSRSGQWPCFERDEIEAAMSVLHSGAVNYWTGDECRKFEREFADYHGVEYGVALANGTLALELALRVLGIGEGDEVVVTPRSFFASASCVVLSGAKPVFADVDPDSQNITAESIAAVLSNKTRGIIAVHLAGWPCDMPAIMDLARQRGIAVIEDCAQAHGAKVDGRYVGSFGDLAAFSFCQDKIMTTAGEGGMLLANDRNLWSAAWSFKDHGKNWDKVYAAEHPPGFRWLHSGFGTNWRMTEIQGAIGRIQLASWVARRRENAAYLLDGLASIDALRIPVPEAGVDHAYYKFYAFVDSDKLKSGWSRDRILAELGRLGCPGWSGSCPEIYREQAFDDMACPELPVARRLGEQSLMLPVHPTLERDHLDAYVLAYRQVLEEASL